jgi:HEAT repeat protein
VEHLRSAAVGFGVQTAWCWNDDAFKAALLAAARHSDAFVRRGVAELMPQRAGSEGRAAMDALLVDPDPAVAANALRWYGSDLAPELRAAGEEFGEDAERLSLAGVIVPEQLIVTPALTPGWGAADSVFTLFTTAVAGETTAWPARRAWFLRELRAGRTPAIDPEVLVWLGRRGRHDEPGLLAAVRHYASDSLPPIRRAACFALGELGDANDAERLDVAAASVDPLVAAAAAAALARLGS